MPFHVALCLQMNQFSANEKKCCCAKLDELVADFERVDACGQLFRLSPLRLHPLMFVRQRIPVSEYNPFAAPDSFGHATENFQGRTYGGIRRLPYFVYSLLINIVSTALQFAMAAGDMAGLVLVVSPSRGGIRYLDCRSATDQRWAQWLVGAGTDCTNSEYLGGRAVHCSS